VWKLDEKTMTATLVFNVDLGNFSVRFGAAERLSNGNFSFTSGNQGQPPNVFGQTIEVLPDGTKAYVLEVNKAEYRSFRIRTLYEGVSDQLAGNGEGTSDNGDDSRDSSRGDRDQGDGHSGVESPAEDAYRWAHHPTGVDASRAAAEGVLDDFRPAVAAALTALSRPLALPPTSTALTPGDADRLDQLFAAGLDEGVSLLLPRSRRNLWRFGAEDVADAAPGWE
jgi:hypothetical protein